MMAVRESTEQSEITCELDCKRLFAVVITHYTGTNTFYSGDVITVHPCPDIKYVRLSAFKT
jgi:hypothetical protein